MNTTCPPFKLILETEDRSDEGPRLEKSNSGFGVGLNIMSLALFISPKDYIQSDSVRIRIVSDEAEYVGRGADTDIIVASAKAYMNALNRLLSIGV